MYEGKTKLATGVRGQWKRNLVPVDRKLRAGIRRVITGEDLDESRFAGSVLPEKSMHFTMLDVERYSIEHGTSCKALAKGLHGDGRCPH
jgi:hypothetical protein